MERQLLCHSCVFWVTLKDKRHVPGGLWLIITLTDRGPGHAEQQEAPAGEEAALVLAQNPGWEAPPLSEPLFSHL